MILDFLNGALKWVRAKFRYEINGYPVAPQQKAAAEVAVKNAAIEMQQIAGKLTDVKDVALWYERHKAQIKILHIANGALARGGWEQMRPADYARLEPKIAAQYEYARKFAEDVARGRYGPVPADNAAFLQRAAQYANAGRSLYENERVAAQGEALGGDTQSMRLLGGVAHCEDCLSWAGLEWIDTETMLANFPIGASSCRSQCHCVIITRRKKADE